MIDVNDTDRLAFSRRALQISMLAKGVKREEQIKALGDLDVMMTSRYGLKRSLAMLPDGPARNAIMRTAYLIMSGNSIAAQISYGSMQLEKDVPPDAARIMGDIVTGLIQPYDNDATFVQLRDAVKESDASLEPMPERARRYARWVVRGKLYDDGVAVDTALAGYCMAGPSESDNGLLKKIVARALKRVPR